MKSKTINISLPQSLYDAAKKHQKEYHYTAISEMIRDALRWWLDPRLTRNGFTPEFEAQVLRAEKEPRENDVEWDGITPFDEFVLTHPPKGIKNHASHKVRHRVLPKSKKSGSFNSRHREDYQQTHPLVSA